MDAECDGCDWTSFELNLAFQDKEKVVSFLLAHRLIAPTFLCRECQSEVDLNWKTLQFRCNKRRIAKKGHKTKHARCCFKRSALKGSFFEHSHLNVEKILLLTYIFLSPDKSIKHVARELRISPSTVIHWYGFCREVLMNSCDFGEEAPDAYLAESFYKKLYEKQSERFHNFLVLVSQIYNPYKGKTSSCVVCHRLSFLCFLSAWLS